MRHDDGPRQYAEDRHCWHPQGRTRGVEEQLAALPRGDLVRESLENFGALVLARHERDVIDCVNQLAPPLPELRKPL